MRLGTGGLPRWLEEGATVVLPTPMLASVAAEQFDRERLRRGIETWQRPAIYGLDAWLAACWLEARYVAADLPSLLSPAQEGALWHGIIEQEHPELFDVAGTVGLARSAARIMADWHIPAEGELWNEHADALQFQHWLRILRRKCRENGWMTRAEVAHFISSWVESGALVPKLTVFAGFEQIPPALQKVQKALGGLAVPLAFEPPVAGRTALAKNFTDIKSEVEFAARRLRHLFEQKPERSLALLVPELKAQQALVESTLEAVFFPSAAAKLARPKGADLFHISAGKLLKDEPLIAAALLFVKLAFARIDHADASAILRSPFIKGAAAEKYLRAAADVTLRKRRELDVSLLDIERASSACPILSGLWPKVRTLLKKAGALQELSQWSAFISDLLAILGWPGEEESSEREAELADEWKAQLSTLAGLGLVTAAVTFAAALEHLERLLSRPVERGNWSSPIQVLDAQQARGIAFDSAIVAGMSGETWPPAQRISPLIPLKLQRVHGVPGALPANIREERVRATEALLANAPEMLVTYTGELPVMVEKFITAKKKTPPVWEGRLAQESYALEPLERLLDGQAPPFVARGEVRGGTGILKGQSLCPFRAFAEYRLQARCPEDASFGFDARDRGGFVHQALEKVWQRLASQKGLKSMASDELRLLVRAAIAEGVNAKEAGPLHQLSLVAERERLEELILEWLELEGGRSEPFTVETMEQARTFEVPGLRVQLRVDRIDRLNNGKLVLIDYKSGPQTRGKLTGDRPAEPQLLVYAAAVGGGVDGIFFGQLKPREVKAVGFSRNKHFKGQTAEVKKDWESYIAGSRHIVDRLARDFVAGVAEVDPIKGACDYCDSKPFCRVNERGALKENEE